MVKKQLNYSPTTNNSSKNSKKKLSPSRNSNRALWKSPLGRKSTSSFLKSPRSLIPLRNSKIQKNFNVIFDLDETLIFSLENPTEMNIKNYICIPIKYIYNNKYIKNNIFIRPHLFQLIVILKNIPNIKLHVWTSSELEYAIAVVNAIETYLGFRMNLEVFIARKTIQDKVGNIKYLYYNVFKNIIYPDSPNIDNFLVKNLNFLYKHEDFKNIFNNHNTILIDDLSDNIKINSSKNVIWINKWNKTSLLTDNSLEIISKWFKENQDKLWKLRTLTLPEFKVS